VSACGKVRPEGEVLSCPERIEGLLWLVKGGRPFVTERVAAVSKWPKGVLSAFQKGKSRGRILGLVPTKEFFGRRGA